MISQPTQKPVWVAQPADFQRMMQDLSRYSILALDTESNSLFAYREQVCLIQISTGQADYLLDPLALTDLSPLGPIFANPGVEKVFHAAEYDLICLKRDFGFSFENLFDTMVAGRILGRAAVGLGSILEEEFHIHLDKKFQRANWGQRPLPLPQLEYARLDSFYLVALRERLKADLIQKELWELAQEDFRRMCQVHVSANNENGDAVWRLIGRQDLTAQQAAVLNELILYRDQLAEAANVPVFKIMSNELLVNIAQVCPKNRERLMNVNEMHERIFRRHADGLLYAVARGLEKPPLYRKPSKRPDDRYISLLDALREWRKNFGRQIGVESDVVLPKDLLEEIARQYPETPEALKNVMETVPWRYEHYGSQILEIINRP